MLNEKAKKTVWWGSVSAYGLFMLVFSIAGATPHWWGGVVATAVPIIGFFLGQPWKKPEGPV